MRRILIVLALLTVSLLTWRLLGFWVIGGSERFYLLVPPVFLAFYLVFSPERWRGLQCQLRMALGYVVVLTFFCTLYYLFVTAAALPNDSGGILENCRPQELLIAVYFLVAVSMLVLLPLRLLRWLSHWACDRATLATPGAMATALRGHGNHQELSRMPTQSRGHGTHATPPFRRLAASLTSAILLAALLLPYLLAALYVHRIKVPNLSSPKQIIDHSYTIPFNRTCENVAFATADGLTIRGWFIHAVNSPSGRTLIICHGLGANRSNFIHYHMAGDFLNANVLLFDFRGHGDSDGHTVSFGYWEKLDVLAAVHYLRSQRPEQAQQVLAAGISMGSAPLILAAAEVDPPLDGVIIDSAYTSAVELTDNILAPFPPLVRPCLAIPGVPIASLHAGCSLNDIRPIDHIASIRAPLLIIHARHDKLIPVEHAERLYQAAAEPKLKWIAETGGHGSAWADRDGYLQWLRNLDGHIDPHYLLLIR